jgi:hypothetical protein
MSGVRTALGVFGVLSTLFGVGLLLAPGLVETGPVGSLTDAVASAESTELMLVLGVAAGVLVGVAAWPGARPATDGSRQFDDAMEGRAGNRAVGLLGADIETGIREGGDSWRHVRRLLADTASTAYARKMGVSPEAAETAVDRGRWTDDDLVAGVLGGGVSWQARLRMWLVPERERRRRVERTIAAIERLETR